jgi:hypothetical protein
MKKQLDANAMINELRGDVGTSVGAHRRQPEHLRALQVLECLGPRRGNCSRAAEPHIQLGHRLTVSRERVLASHRAVPPAG